MTDTPEIAEWLTRFEKRFGADQTASALGRLSNARDLFYNELGYNVTRKQFEALNQGENEKNQYLIELNIRAETGRKITHKDGSVTYQTNYRDAKGHFTKSPFATDIKSLGQLSSPTAPRPGRESRRGYENRKARG